MTQRNKDAGPSSWVLTQTDLMKVVFHKYAQSGFLEGNRAAELLSASRLAFPTLARIWDMADKDGDGRLDETEFVLAFHLCVCVSKRNLLLPEQLPELLEKWYADQKARKLPRYAKGNKVIHTRSSDGLQRRGTVVGVHADDIVRGFYYTVRLDGDDQQELQANEERLSHDEPGRVLARANSSIPDSENSFVAPPVSNSDDDFGDFEGGESSVVAPAGTLESPVQLTVKETSTDQDDGDVFGQEFVSTARLEPPMLNETTAQDEGDLFGEEFISAASSEPPGQPNLNEISPSDQDDGDEFMGEFVQSTSPSEPPVQPTLNEASPSDPTAHHDDDEFISAAPSQISVQQTLPSDATAQDDSDTFGGGFVPAAPSESPVQFTLKETFSTDQVNGDVFGGEFVQSPAQDEGVVFGGEFISAVPLEPSLPALNEASPSDPTAQDDGDVFEREFVQSDPTFHSLEVPIDQTTELSNDLSASNSNIGGEEHEGTNPIETVDENKLDFNGDSSQEDEDAIIASITNNNRGASPVFNSGSEEEFVSVPPATTTASSSSPEQISHEEATMEELPATDCVAVSPFDIKMGDSGGAIEDDDGFEDFAHVESVPLQVTDSGLLFRESSRARSDPFGETIQNMPSTDECEIPQKDTNFTMDSIPKVFQKVDEDDDFGGDDDFVVAPAVGIKEPPSDPAVDGDDSFEVQALPTFAGIDHSSQSLTVSSFPVNQQQQQQPGFTLIDDLDFGDFSAPPPSSSSSSLQRANTAPMETPKGAATVLQRTSTAPTVGRSGGFSLRKAPAPRKNDGDDDFDFSTAISTSQGANWMSSATGEGGRVPFASRTPAKPPKVDDDEDDDDGGIVFDMSTPQKE